MIIEEWKRKLRERNVPDRWYSIDGKLKIDAYILRKKKSKWEYFYFDEKEQITNTKTFTSEEDAYDFLWKQIEFALDVFKTKPREKT